MPWRFAIRLLVVRGHCILYMFQTLVVAKGKEVVLCIGGSEVQQVRRGLGMECCK